MALIHVDAGGLNAHWCKNWMSLALDDVCHALWAAWVSNWVSGFADTLLVLVGTIHRPVAGWRRPSSISSALRNTLHVFFVKIT